MMLTVPKSHTKMNSAPRLRIVPRAPELDPISSDEAFLRHVEMECTQGYRVLDDAMADRLESLAKDQSLPTAMRARAMRARAMSALCRFG